MRYDSHYGVDTGKYSGLTHRYKLTIVINNGKPREELNRELFTRKFKEQKNKRSIYRRNILFLRRGSYQNVCRSNPYKSFHGRQVSIF